MTIASGPFAIACVLLALGGAAKAVRPGDTARALDGVGVRVPAWGVRLGGAAEAVLGTVALVRADSVTAALVAASYLAFAVFVIVALVRDAPIATCGCFGRADSPPSLVHVGIDVVAAAAAIVVALDPGAGIADVVTDQPVAGVPYLLLVATGVLCAYLALTLLPRTMQLVTESRRA
jgi:hypothetical protein